MILHCKHFLWVLLLWISITVNAEKDFYETLGINKDASLKDIRKAFKKLALKLHPDKNINDPEAHDKFVRINQIYEVLKDEDMRKKYDKYGEEGLKEDHPGGGRYESYSYYRDEFGIYDDDPDVVTLDGGDFDAAINSGEAWFVNFYSPRCSHCHELAPTPIKYQGDRSRKDLIRFVMKHVNIENIDLWDGNVKEETEKRKTLPWVVSFCGGGKDEEMEGDCPSKTTKRKLAGLMNGLAYVASVECDTSPDLCKNAKVTQKLGVYYFSPGTFPGADDNMHHFLSLDAREIHAEFMNKLVPALPTYSKEKFEALTSTKRLLIFLQYADEVDTTESSLKKLPALLLPYRITVAKVNCDGDDWCRKQFHLRDDATLMFKGKGIKDFEIFHGRLSTAEISSFAQESSQGRVTTLNPTYFDNRAMIDTGNPWFVDFFAPWCPPCRALLPELRKASRELNDIKFGTIDCTLFKDICNRFNIHSYPTTMLFNESRQTEYTGHHNSRGILQFVKDLIDPPYVDLTPESFQSLVQRRGVGETWIVDFYANWCGPCRQLLPEWRRMAKLLIGVVKVGAIDCAKGENRKFCQRNMVDAYPEIRLFPAKKRANSNPLYKVYNDWNRQAFAMASWALESTLHGVIDMELGDFKNGLPKDSSAWLVDFYAPWCGHCNAFAPKFILSSLKYKGNVKFGKVNCDMLPSVCNMNGVNAYPTIYFYPPQSPGEKRPRRKLVTAQNPDVIVRNLEGFMKQYPDMQTQTKEKLKDEL